MRSPIYLDYNGTTPHDPAVIEAMRPYLETHFGNPSSSHWYGDEPRQAVDSARRQVAGLLNCDPAELLFTSGGTESNNHAIKGIARALRDRGRHLITTTVEHPAVLNVCHYLEREGFETTYVAVDRQGLVHAEDVLKALRKDTILVTIMHANNEVGTIQPIAEIAALAHDHGVLMHTDAAQSVGKIDTDVQALGVDLLSVAGHKLYAPKGVGALFVRQGVAPDIFCHGAGQEGGQRGGTENVLEIVGLGAACELITQGAEKYHDHLMQMRDRLHQGIETMVRPVRLNGHPQERLPNTLSLGFKDLAANDLLDQIGPYVAASAGAACHADTIHVSHVLEAMQVPLEWARGTVRFSVGRMTTTEQIDTAVDVVARSVGALRSKSS
jgi:cysteine desulfurase